MGKLTAEAHFIILMVTYTKVILEMIEPMVMVSIIIKMDRNIKALGEMT